MVKDIRNKEKKSTEGYALFIEEIKPPISDNDPEKTCVLTYLIFGNV